MNYYKIRRYLRFFTKIYCVQLINSVAKCYYNKRLNYSDSKLKKSKCLTPEPFL